jgi:hypothetical protein
MPALTAHRQRGPRHPAVRPFTTSSRGETRIAMVVKLLTQCGAGSMLPRRNHVSSLFVTRVAARRDADGRRAGRDTAQRPAFRVFRFRVVTESATCPLTGWATQDDESPSCRVGTFSGRQRKYRKESARRRLARPLVRTERRGGLRRSPLRGAGSARTDSRRTALPRRAARRAAPSSVSATRGR